MQVFEHQKIRYSKDGEFQQCHFDALVDYNKKSKGKFFNIIHNGVEFTQFVGVLQVGKLTIEILPKIDKHEVNKQKWHNVLLRMLKECRMLKTEYLTNADLKLRNNSILDIYVEIFLNETDSLLRHGLVKKYHIVEDNRNALKGKLLFNKHVTRNLVHKENFYVQYQVYDRDNIYNRIIHKALCVIPQLTCNPSVTDKLNRIFLDFPEQKDLQVSDNLFDSIYYDRKTEHYKTAINIARLLLLNYSPDIRHGTNNVLAILFDMNILWEEFIYRQLKKLEGKIIKSVKGQVGKNFWRSVTSKYSKGIKPDIVIKTFDEENIVVDTKWKLPINKMPNDDDLKQLFVYNLYYDAPTSILLYPGNEQNVTGAYYNFPPGKDLSNRYCHMAYIGIDKIFEFSDEGSKCCLSKNAGYNIYNEIISLIPTL